MKHTYGVELEKVNFRKNTCKHITILLKYLPFVVLSELSVGIETSSIESGLTLKPPNWSCLAASDRRVKTLLTTTL